MMRHFISMANRRDWRVRETYKTQVSTGSAKMSRETKNRGVLHDELQVVALVGFWVGIEWANAQ